MKSSNHSDDFIWRDLEREMAHHERSLAKKQQPPQKPPAPRPLTSIGFLGKKGEKGGASSRYLLR